MNQEVATGDIGIISRTTLATAVIGDVPLALATKTELKNECHHSDDVVVDMALDSMESLRDIVTDISNAFIQTLDDILGGITTGGCLDDDHHRPPLMKRITGEIYPTIRLQRVLKLTGLFLNNKVDFVLHPLPYSKEKLSTLREELSAHHE